VLQALNKVVTVNEKYNHFSKVCIGTSSGEERFFGCVVSIKESFPRSWEGSDMARDKGSALWNPQGEC
jgi:hypothetical protein